MPPEGRHRLTSRWRSLTVLARLIEGSAFACSLLLLVPVLGGPGAGVISSMGANAITTAPSASRYYELVSRQSGKVLDVSRASLANDGPVIQWPTHSGDNQQFRFVPANDGGFEIVARHSGKVLDVAHDSNANGANVVQAVNIHSIYQQWSVGVVGDGYVTLTNYASGKSLSVVAATDDSGALIGQWDSGGRPADSQQWQLVKADRVPTPSLDQAAGKAPPAREVALPASSPASPPEPSAATDGGPAALPDTFAAPSTKPSPVGEVEPKPGSADAQAAAGIGAATTPGTAPSRRYPIGLRSFSFSRAGRSLPTKIWYPATLAAGHRTGAAAGAYRARLRTPVARGRFPLVVFSHGSGGLPDYYVDEILPLTAAGFIVIGPAYPHTKHGVSTDVEDVANQPLDASQVLTDVLAMDGQPGSFLYRHIDSGHGIGAYGHSLGGVTTAGLLTLHRDARITAAVILAGAGLGGSPTGPRANVLFIHGDKDPAAAYSSARSLYASIPWPKAFLTQVGSGHDNYVFRKAGYSQTVRTADDWFRWSLYGDQQARRRLPADAAGSNTGATRYRASIR